MRNKAIKCSIFALTGVSTLVMTACSPNLGTSSNNTTSVKAANPLVTTQANTAQLAELRKHVQTLMNSGTEIQLSEQDKKELKLSNEEQIKAEESNFKGHVNDDGLEDVLAQDSSLQDIVEVPANKPEEKKSEVQPAPDKSATDMSPLKILRNLKCEKLGTGFCLKALTPSVEQAIGYYAVGGIKHASELPIDGLGCHIKSNSSSHRYGTAHMILFLQKISKVVIDRKISDEIVVGDISKRLGGYLAGHRSHQNGLDIDIGFIGTAEDTTSHDHFPTSFVQNEKLDTTKFDVEKNWQFVQAAVGSKWTYLIFAHPAIKKVFCEKANATGEPEKYREVLSQILPEPTHDNHFHIRLKCPESSPECVPARIRSTDSGC